MSYIEKERNLLKAMQDANFPPNGNKEMVLRMIEKSLRSFQEYAIAVITQQLTLPLLKVEKEGAEYREAVQELDASRTKCHNHAINSLNILNRMCKNVGLEPFADVNTEERREVAKMIGEYCSEVFGIGINLVEPEADT